MAGEIMAILSASRKTDIPTYFSEWFLNRLDAGEIYTRNNPYNPNTVQRVTFNRKDIDCIVFWTKNPIPMLSKLDRLQGYTYYFQFTLTGYGKDIESNLPPKAYLIQAFKELSYMTDKRVIWRYDPIVFTCKYSPDWHLTTFEKLAEALSTFSDRCVISFMDEYAFVKRHMAERYTTPEHLTPENLTQFCRRLAEIANSWGFDVYTCAEAIDFEKEGINIKHGSCIDKDYIEQLVGYPIGAKKDKGQRAACGCVESVDVGKYNTCLNKCAYCYASTDKSMVQENLKLYDATSPILCDRIDVSMDIITERPLKSLRVDEKAKEVEQLTLFDYR